MLPTVNLVVLTKDCIYISGRPLKDQQRTQVMKTFFLRIRSILQKLLLKTLMSAFLRNSCLTTVLCFLQLTQIQLPLKIGFFPRFLHCIIDSDLLQEEWTRLKFILFSTKPEPGKEGTLEYNLVVHFLNYARAQLCQFDWSGRRSSKFHNNYHMQGVHMCINFDSARQLCAFSCQSMHVPWGLPVKAYIWKAILHMSNVYRHVHIM